MPVATLLKVVGAEGSKGKCPWRMTYLVDGQEVRAFFKPPLLLESRFTASDAAFLSLPIACHLAADVRPRTVSLSGECALPGYAAVFRSAIRGLLLEQDAYWGRRQLTEPPILRRSSGTKANPSNTSLDKRVVVLGFSGGKDSLVCLFSLIEAGYTVVPVLLNEGDRTWQDLRRWIPKLQSLGLHPLTAYLKINSRSMLHARYGSWHRSSYQIGWLVSLLALTAQKIGAGVIAMGLESSADRAGYQFRGKQVNHQHQKTTQHILQIQEFLNRTVNPELRIASPIAPFSDEQILRALFRGVPSSWREFSSCGSSNSTSKHCGACDKCAYIFALLARSSEGRLLAQQTFRSDLLQDVALYRPWIDARYREPLACVGERWELWDALEDVLTSRPSAAVLQVWLTSPFRRELQRLKSLGSHLRATADVRLTHPVYRATQVISKWIKHNSISGRQTQI